MTRRTTGRRPWRVLASIAALLLWSVPHALAEDVLRYFPVGPIYDYRWKLLEEALRHTGGPSIRLEPYGEDVTQNRGVLLLQSGTIDVIALGTNPEREAKLRPVRVDILRGIVGYRLLVIRGDEQSRMAALDESAFRRQLTFGLNSQWADLAIMKANGLAVTTSSNSENLFGMLAAGRFDAFPRGLNEAQRELDARRDRFPQLSIEASHALFFPYPIYFWVRADNPALAQRIERGLNAMLADGSFRRLFEANHVREIEALQRERRQVIVLDNPMLPPNGGSVDTSWWWPEGTLRH